MESGFKPNRFESFPFIIAWELTHRCNLQCLHCASGSQLAKTSELDTKSVLEICDQLPDLLVREVNFTGGEPLLRHDLFEIISHLNELKIKTKIVTNGILLSNVNVDRLYQLEISGIGISLDGLERGHDKLRQADGLFKLVLNRVESLNRYGIPITILTTITSENCDVLEDMFLLLERLKIDKWRLQYIYPMGRAIEHRDYLLNKKNIVHYYEKIKGLLAVTKNRKPTLILGDNIGYYLDIEEASSEWKGCSAGIITCGITPTGDVKGCLTFPDHITEGNLLEKKLWDIWFDSNSFLYNRDVRRNDIGSNCSKCDKACLCGGGCSIMSLAYTGRFHNDPFCHYEKRDLNLI